MHPTWLATANTRVSGTGELSPMILCVGSGVTLEGDAAGAVASADGGAEADSSLGRDQRLDLGGIWKD